MLTNIFLLIININIPTSLTLMSKTTPTDQILNLAKELELAINLRPVTKKQIKKKEKHAKK